LPLPIPWDPLIRCLIATGIMALAVGALPTIGGLPELMMDASIGGIVYAACALTMNAAGVRDILLDLIARFRARSVAA